MKHDYFDRYSRLASPIHRRSPGLKLACAFIFLLTTLLVPQNHFLYHLPVVLVLILIAALSRIPPFFLIRRLLMLEPFVLGVAVLTLFQPHGLAIFLALFIKCTLCLFTMILLSNTTPFAELLRLFQKIHVPGLMITTLALMYRYLFVLLDESDRMKRARTSRTFSRRRTPSWQTLSTVITQLFIRTSERAERIYAAMCARGWQ